MRRLRLVLLALAAGGCGDLPGNEATVCKSESKNVLAGCEARYDLCAGGAYRLACAPSSAGALVCDCQENGTSRRIYDGSDECQVSPDTLKKRAAAGCGWKLD